MKSLVSVIVPAYNRAAVLPRAVESVRNQTYENWELLICDDASTDNTADVVAELQQQDDRIKLLRHQKNLGAAEARNTPMKAAQGSYIALLDSDDEWLPEKLEKQIAALETAPEGVGICLTGAKIIKNQLRSAYDIPQKDWEENTFVKFLDGTISYTTSTIVFRRSCLKTTGLMTSALRRGQDEDLLLRILLHYRLITIQDVLVKMNLCTVKKNLFTHILIQVDHMVRNYYKTIEIAYGKNTRKYSKENYNNNSKQILSLSMGHLSQSTIFIL